MHDFLSSKMIGVIALFSASISVWVIGFCLDVQMRRQPRPRMDSLGNAIFFNSSWIAPFLLFGCSLSLAFAGIVSFGPWQQIEDIFENGFDMAHPVSALSHLPRYFAASPPILLSSILRLDLIVCFTLYVLVVAFLTSLAWCMISRLQGSSWKCSMLLSCIPFFLLLVTNGRFSFILLGLAILSYNKIRVSGRLGFYGYAILDLTGLVFSSVSSGVFMVAAGIWFLFRRQAYVLAMPPPLRLGNTASVVHVSRVYMMRLFVVVVTWFFVCFWGGLFAFKNMTFFGGLTLHGVQGLIGHGFGSLLGGDALSRYCIQLAEAGLASCDFLSSIFKNIYWGISGWVAISVGALALAFLILKSNRIDELAKAIIFLAILFGAFGLTTLFSILAAIPLVGFGRKFSATC